MQDFQIPDSSTFTNYIALINEGRNNSYVGNETILQQHLSPSLHSEAIRLLEIQDITLAQEINLARKTAQDNKVQICDGIQKLYSAVTEAMLTAIKSQSEMRLSVPNDHYPHDNSDALDSTSWLNNNPSAAVVVKNIFDQLSLKGWKPSIAVDESGEFHRPCLLLVCSFAATDV